MTLDNPPWPGKPEAHGFEQLEDDLNDWCYTLWKNKIWFCTIYNGNVNVNKIRAKEDVGKVVLKNNFIDGVINSPICERTKFFFDCNKNICGIETDCQLTEEGISVEYLMNSKINFYKKCLEYLVKEEI